MRPKGKWNCVGALVDDLLCVVPEMCGAIPHHLFLLQSQSFNYAFAVLNKLAAQSFLHRSYNTFYDSIRDTSSRSFRQDVFQILVNRHFLGFL